MTKFKKGDAVRLLNGHSPIMTVLTASPTATDGVYTCVWFDVTSNYRTNVFVGSVLKKVESNPA